MKVINAATDLIRDVYEPIFFMSFDKNNRVGVPPTKFKPPPVPQYTRNQWSSPIDKINNTEQASWSSDDMFYAMKQVLYTIAAPVMNPELNAFAKALDDKLGIPQFGVHALDPNIFQFARELGDYVREFNPNHLLYDLGMITSVISDVYVNVDQVELRKLQDVMASMAS